MSRQINKSRTRQHGGLADHRSINWGFRRFLGIWLFAFVIMLVTVAWRGSDAIGWAGVAVVVVIPTLIATVESFWPGRSGF